MENMETEEQRNRRKDKERADEIMENAIKVAQSPIICECSFKRKISQDEIELYELCKKISSEARKPRSIHSVNFLDQSIKCRICNKHWCCGECAIEEDAIPGFLDYNKKFSKGKDPENKNITLIDCLLCKKAK